MQLVNQVIYSNIYSPLVNGESVEMQTSHLPPTPDNLKEGHLLLQRGGLASFKWKKYEHFDLCFVCCLAVVILVRLEH